MDSLEAFYPAYADARCEFMVRCNEEAGAGYEIFCHPFVRANTWDAPVGQSFDLDAANDCLDSFRRATPTCDGTDIAIACSDLFRGESLEDDACSDDGQCAPGLVCRDADSREQCSGTCQSLAVEGEPCAARRECASGLYCDDGVCVPRLGSGEPCDGGFECMEGTRCSDEARCLSLTEFEGQPCDPEVDVCPFGFACSDAGRCEPHAIGVRPGPDEACTVDGPPCPYTHRCTDGACTALPVLGEACDDERPCLEDYGACVDGTCRLLPPGTPCDAPGTCEGYCDPLVCVAYRGLGEACEFSLECGPGAACEGAVCVLEAACE